MCHLPLYVHVFIVTTYTAINQSDVTMAWKQSAKKKKD